MIRHDAWVSVDCNGTIGSHDGSRKPVNGALGRSQAGVHSFSGVSLGRSLNWLYHMRAHGGGTLSMSLRLKHSLHCRYCDG